MNSINSQKSIAVEDDEIDLRLYISILLRYKWKIFLLTILITLLALVVSFSLTPIYQSTTLVLIESDNAKVISIEEIYGISSANREYFQTQLEILKSRSLVEKLVNKLNLTQHRLYDPVQQVPSRFAIKPLLQHWLPESWGLFPEKAPPTQTEIFNATVGAVMKNLSITLLRNSQLVKISFESPDPALAKQVPNELADIYIENDLEARLQMTQKATSWLTARLEGLREKLEASEKALQAYMEKNELIDVEGVKSVTAGQLTNMSSDLTEAKRKLAELGVIFRQTQALKGQPASYYESIPEVLRHPLVQRLKEVELDKERSLSELSKRYGKKHPSIIAAQSELDSAKANTASQIRKVISGIQKNYEAAQENVRILQSSMRITENEIQDITRKGYKLAVLKREAETNRQLYDMFLKRFKETDAAQSQQSTIARIVDPAVEPNQAIKPKKPLIVVIAFVLGLMFSILLVFLLEHLDNTIKTFEDVELKLGILLLGFLPKLNKKQEKNIGFISLQDDKTQFAESIRTIRTGIMLSGLDNPHKVLLITSTIPAEGKTTLAMNQAFALGQLKKTILIDADLRKPSIGRRLGLSIKTPGLSEVVAGEKPLADCIQKVEGLSVDFLLSGMIPPNPLEMLSSTHFQAILAALEKDYEQIVIDSAPAHAVSDALVLSKYANAVVYVVKADETPYQLVQSGLKRLQQVEAPVLGVILNQFNIEKATKYYYGKQAYYYKTYYGQYNDADNG